MRQKRTPLDRLKAKMNTLEKKLAIAEKTGDVLLRCLKSYGRHQRGCDTNVSGGQCGCGWQWIAKEFESEK